MPDFPPPAPPGASLKDFSFLTSDVTLTEPGEETIISRTLTFVQGDYLIRAIMQSTLHVVGATYPLGLYCESRIGVDGVLKSYAAVIWHAIEDSVHSVPLVTTCRVTLSAGSHTIALLAYLESSKTTMTISGEPDMHVTSLEIWRLG
jgi:hypothetical protein